MCPLPSLLIQGRQFFYVKIHHYDFYFITFYSVDEPCTRHKLFDVYEDVCRISPGQDQDWTVGMTDIVVKHDMIFHYILEE